MEHQSRGDRCAAIGECSSAANSISRMDLFQRSGESPSPLEVFLNSRRFVTGLSSVCSLVLLRGGIASIEHTSRLEQRVRAQRDLGVSDGLTAGAVMMVVQ